MLFGRAHPVLSGMDELRVELVGMDFMRHNFFGCCILLCLDGRQFRIYGCLTFQLSLLGDQKSGVICTLVKIGGQQKSVAGFVHRFLVKTNPG